MYTGNYMNSTPETPDEQPVISRNQSRTRLYIGIGIILTGLLVGLFMYNNQSQRIDIVYQPTSACTLLTKSIAQEFLGKEVLGGNGDQEIGDTGTATSDCSYTDSNEDENAMRVIAVKVRSGYDDIGLAQNKRDFAAHKAANDTEAVENVGTQAFFNRTNSQLHVLTDKTWMIVSYVEGKTPSLDALGKTTAIAKRMLASHK